jgi:hypothetical protein
MANEMYPFVTEKNITEFMDICLVLNVVIDQAFENNLIVLLNEEIQIEWGVIKNSLASIHNKANDILPRQGGSYEEN